MDDIAKIDRATLELCISDLERRIATAIVVMRAATDWQAFFDEREELRRLKRHIDVVMANPVASDRLRPHVLALRSAQEQLYAALNTQDKRFWSELYDDLGLTGGDDPAARK